jgi:hypothetical protein
METKAYSLQTPPNRQQGNLALWKYYPWQMSLEYALKIKQRGNHA